MAIKNDNINSGNEFIELENQLSCPKGEFGIEIGNLMNKSNIQMTLNSIDLLDIKNNNFVLEIGHGNCGHLSNLLKVADNIHYFGLEISETMRNEAQKNNLNFNAEFKLYNGLDIPFNDNFFDRILAINTIYFWENPLKLLLEIERTLKPGGNCVITFAHKDYLQKLPYTKNKFRFYNMDRFKDLVKATNLFFIDFIEINDKSNNKFAETDDRKYIIVKLNKA